MIQIIYMIQFVFQVLSLAIIARALISWFPISPDHPVVLILHQLTDPLVAPIRRYMPATMGFDLSPLIALILLQVIERILIGLLVEIA